MKDKFKFKIKLKITWEIVRYILIASMFISIGGIFAFMVQEIIKTSPMDGWTISIIILGIISILIMMVFFPVYIFVTETRMNISYYLDRIKKRPVIILNRIEKTLKY